VQRGPSRGLPSRTVVPIVIVFMAVFLGIVGYFLKTALFTTGSAIGPIAQQGDANIRSSAPPAATAAAALPSTDTGEVVVPQTGGGATSTGGEAGGVQPGAAPPAVAMPGAAGPPGAGAGAAGGGPPAPVMAMLASLRARLAANPKDLSALVTLANLYFDANKFSQSLPYYRRALALDPENPDVRTDYATALHGAGDDLAALRELDTVLAKRPKFVEALFNEGVVASAIGRRTEAIGAFKSFIADAPSDRRVSDARAALQNLGAS